MTPPGGVFRTKSLGVKLDKDTYIKFRTLLFNYDLSVQEVLEAVIESMLAEDDKWLRFLHSLVKTKMKKKVDEIHIPKAHNPLSEKDVEALYDLIAESDKEEVQDEEG